MREPRLVRRRVSGAMDTLKAVGTGVVGELSGARSSSVMVRHVPLQDMLSPRAASERIVGQDEMVNEVPEPPVLVESSWSNWDIADGL